VRRFQFVIEFPLPDVQTRRQLWERLLPPRAPRHPDLDLDLLARAVPLSGGGIRNAALHAAVMASARDGEIELHDAALAVWRELRKSGREISPADLNELDPHLKRDVVGC